jgi:hypothetical protein
METNLAMQYILSGLEWIWNNNRSLASLGLFASGVAAAIVAPAAYFKFKADRASLREQTAKALYKSYLLLCIQHPKFGYPATSNVNYKDGLFENDTDLFESYEWFVSYLLMTATELHQLKRNNTQWKSVIMLQLWYHQAYFVALNDKELPYLRYRPELKRLIDQVRSTREKPGYTPGQKQTLPKWATE